MTPAPGFGRISVALMFGIVVHVIFTAAVFAMISMMYSGMSRSLGNVTWPLATLTNALLILQFPIVHSFLLTRKGTGWLAKVVPGPHGAALSTTTYAIVASCQLLLLFALWTPSGIIWWEAEGTAKLLMTGAYAAAWLLLIKASWDAGAEVQSGALGWMSLMKGAKPRYPGMPTTGLFRVIRQPIYVAFALTLWTVPVWTPDQLVLAITLTSYCLLAPLLKERRFAQRYGSQFTAYQRQVPYAVPSFNLGDTDGASRTQ